VHKFFPINKYFCRYFCLCLITIALLGTQIVRANDEQFQNSLLKMDVYKTSLGGVKVNLYTTKPYKDNIVVNKKSDNQYVILMPETVNSMTAKPILKSTSDVLTNVEVKTQPYGSTPGQKGYTKIIFSTQKPIEITTQIQTVNVSEHQLTEKETQELLNQAGKKQITAPIKQATKAPITPPVVVKRTAQTQKVTQNPVQRFAQKMTRGVNRRANQKQASRTISSPVQKSQPQRISPKTITKVVVPTKPVQTPTLQKEENITTPVEKPTEVKEVQPTQETLVPQKVPAATVVPPIAPPVSQPTGLRGKFEKIKNILIAKKELLGLIIAPLILLLLLLRIIRKKRSKKQTDKNIFQTTPPAPMATSATDYANGITDDMDWKEKFKAYKNQPQRPQRPQQTTGELPEDTASKTGMDSENWLEEETGLDEPLTKTPEEAVWEIPTEMHEETQKDTSWLEFEDQEILKEASIDDLFNDDDDKWPKEEITEEAKEEDYSSFSQEVIPQEEAVQEEFPQERVSEGELPEEELPQEESPQEEFLKDEFSFEQAFEGLQTKQPQEELAEEPWLTYELEEPSIGNIIEPTSEISYEEQEENFQEELVEKELGLSKKSDFAIDASKGFYLLDFEDTTTLVGYINEDIFILKRFEEPVEGNIKARLSEHKGDSADYITRIGDFKALVEVTPEKMNLLIEL